MLLASQVSSLDRCLELAELGRGRTSPNPMVGAVVVRDGEVVAEGHHSAYGERHAEYAALTVAGYRARGSTLYCNLEPCCFRSPAKHQPPCTDAIIAAGVEKVVIGQRDPNPRVDGGGVRLLREAGIEVELLDDETCWRFNDRFNTRQVLKRPFVQLKAALSLDGRIAASGGDSRWISDEAARRLAHRFRGEADAVAVGIGTLLADDPLLTNRSGVGGTPKAVVFDSRLRTPLDSQLVRKRADELILLCSEDADSDRRRHLEALGVTVIGLKPRAGRLDPAETLRRLKELGITSLMVEGGSALLSSFVQSGAWDRLNAVLAPILLGRGVEFLGEIGVASMEKALGFENVEWEQLGEQQLFLGYRRGWLEEVRGVHRID